MKATHRRIQRDPQRCKSINHKKGRRNEALSITLAMLKDFLFQQSPNGTRKQKRSPSEARAEPERVKGLRKEHGTPKGRSKAEAEPKRSPSEARTEHRTSKGARDFERTFGVPPTLFRDRRICRHSGNTPCLLIKFIRLLLFESKTRTHHGPVGSVQRTAGRRGCAGHGSKKERFSSR